MELILPWMPVVWVVAIVVAALVVARNRRSSRPAEAKPIAHVERLTALPEYRSAVRRYRAVLAAVVVAATVLVLSAGALAARPAAPTLVYPETGNRDIVLCLDVSGSMIDYDRQLVEVFGELAREFDGERISLVVFNASAVTYFPLTSDYDYIVSQFDRISEQFDADEGEYFSGTFFGDGSSLVGDGLASCAQRFDTPEVDRSRSVILATDNLVVGEPVFTLADAGELATSRDIRVYGINPGGGDDGRYLEEFAIEFEEVVLATGGSYFAVDDPAAVPTIVDSISAEEAVASRGAPETLLLDRPEIPATIAFLALATLLALAWRVDR
ncbi:vWA domain-containing protein [Marisediminicola sp. LYQ85]|uniref:vWA domain-containing protein n=1 Tax=Marisediminicola sp. LYQ85 TaxID=3391062 RepID=UPI003983CCD6